MSTDLLFPYADSQPAASDVLAVAPGILWVRMPLPFQLNHINLWLLADGEGWTLVDTGIGSRTTREHWEQIFVTHLGGKPITRIIVTHDHPDHIGCASWIAERYHCEVWMSYAEFLAAHLVWHDLGGWEQEKMAAYFRLVGLPDSAVEAYVARGNTYRQSVPGLPTTFRRLIGGDTVQIDGCNWLAIAGYGHSPEHIALYCADKQVLISGDMLLPKISTNVGAWGNEPAGDSLARFLDSLSAFEPLPAETLVLPSHGRPFIGIQPRIGQLRQHHIERLALLEGACATSKTAFELIPVLFGRVFDNYQTFFALAETLAHLNHLWQTGRMQRELGQDGVARFIGK